MATKKSTKKTRTASLSAAQQAFLASRKVSGDQLDAIKAKLATKQDSRLADRLERLDDTYTDDKVETGLQDKAVARTIALRDLEAEQSFNLDCDLERATLLATLKATDPNKYALLIAAGVIPDPERATTPTPTTATTTTPVTVGYDATKGGPNDPGKETNPPS